MAEMGDIGPREVTASVLRGITDELRERGLYDEVRARVPDDVARAMDKPGMILTWHKSSTTDAILDAAASLGGRATVREIGFSMMTRRGMGTLLRPLLDFWLKFSGSGPAALYARLDVAAAVLMRGTSFVWIPRGDSAGTVRLISEGPAPDANWALWEGVFEYAYVLTHTKGTVARGRPGEDARTCDFDVAWAA
jgi:hypothetical protein